MVRGVRVHHAPWILPIRSISWKAWRASSFEIRAWEKKSEGSRVHRLEFRVKDLESLVDESELVVNGLVPMI